MAGCRFEDTKVFRLNGHYFLPPNGSQTADSAAQCIQSGQRASPMPETDDSPHEVQRDLLA